ncbi:hypothetical protein, partial [Mesorhizobium sp.]|uniref:hypothetical protein n=1 Tax=Mesorhizobium sp. TaxID=1871066 RepID=UPI002581072C
LVVGEISDEGQSPPSWGRCPAGQRGREGSERFYSEPLHSSADCHWNGNSRMTRVLIIRVEYPG